MAGLKFTAGAVGFGVKPVTPGRPVVGRPAAVAAVAVGYCALQAEDDSSLSVLTELGDGAPRVVEGFGGWEAVERRGRIAMTHWTGYAPLKIELELYLDDFAAGKSIEPAITILDGLAGRGQRSTGGRPPLIIVDTAGVMPYDVRTFPDTRWVIDQLDYSADEEEASVNSVGNRTRQAVGVTLLQYVDDARLQNAELAARIQLQAKRKSARMYTVKAGENLITIARAKLGNADRWTEIAKVNGLRDPRAVKAGARIRLP